METPLYRLYSILTVSVLTVPCKVKDAYDLQRERHVLECVCVRCVCVCVCEVGGKVKCYLA